MNKDLIIMELLSEILIEMNRYDDNEKIWSTFCFETASLALHVYSGCSYRKIALKKEERNFLPCAVFGASQSRF